MKVRKFVTKWFASNADRIDDLSPLAGQINDSDKEIRFIAYRSLCKQQDGVYLGLLTKCVTSDEDDDIRAWVVSSLGTHEDSDIQAFVMDRAQNEKSIHVRSSAMRALQSNESSESLAILLAGLSEKEPRVRMSAAAALGELKPEKAFQPLIAMLKDADEGVRSEALDALRKYKRKEVCPHIIPLFNDSNFGIRRYSAEMIAEFNYKEGVLPLIRSLYKLKPHQRYFQTRALLELSGTDFGEDVKLWEDWYHSVYALK